MARRPPSIHAALLTLALLVPPAGAQQGPQFRADVARVGNEPFDGTIYFGSGRMRIEGTSDGEPFTAIVNRQANSIIVVMPADQVYMTMDLGSAPFSTPAASPMDPANPCADGELTECRSLGTETINGHAARGWEFTRDGERETAWISNQLSFPVRTVEADGTTTDFTNVEMGPQPAALFEPPAGYTAMDVGAMFGGRGGPPGGRAGRGQVPPAVGRGQPPAGGRGQAAGRGAVPPGGRGQAAGRGAPAPAAGGVDPAAAAQLTAQLQAMGLPPDQIAMALAQLNAAAATQGIDYSAWESGDGWIADLVVTASYDDTQQFDRATSTRRYTARFTGSVPITYGTPGAAGMGPAWQLVPGIGSPLGEAQAIVFSGTSEYRVETTWAAACPVEEGRRVVSISRATGSTDTADPTAKQLGGQARWEIAGDLSTHTLMAGVAATETTETTESTTTITSRCPMSESQNGTEQETRQPQMAIQVNLPGLPLPASPGVMRGTATATMGFDLGGTLTQIPANVEWTLRPIS
jgi:hypothetical protein